MEEEGETHLLEAFGVLIDPRVRECPHPLDELLLVAICAITSGAEGWVACSGQEISDTSLSFFAAISFS